MKVLLLILLETFGCNTKYYSNNNAYEMLQIVYPKATVFSIITQSGNIFLDNTILDISGYKADLILTTIEEFLSRF